MKILGHRWILTLLLPLAILMIARLFSAFRSSSSSSSAATAAAINSPPTSPTALNAYNAIRSMSSANGAAGEPQYFTGANGCFWGPDHMYRQAFSGKGLLDSQVGYIGGSNDSPSYEEVCTGRTGHAEAIQVKFDPSKVSYAELVEFMYRTHDPTTKDRQGADRGSQYRSAIFPHNDEQKAIAEKVTAEIQAKHFTPKGGKIVTTIEPQPVGAFWKAEKYHQDYLNKNPSGYHCPTHRFYW